MGKSSNNNKNQKKEKKFQINFTRLIILLIVLLLIGLGAFFLTRYFINNSKTTDNTPKDNEGEVVQTRLLKLLNDNINKTKMGEETLANEITSFSYVDKHFIISGYNGQTVYKYDVDLTSKGFTSTKEALDFLKETDVEGNYEITLNRCESSSSDEFATKYVTEGTTGKYHIGQFVETKYAYATLYKNDQITVINGDELSDTLSSTYSPLVITNKNELFSIYKYIATGK